MSFLVNSWRFFSDAYSSTKSLLFDGVNELLDIDTSVSELVSHTVGTISMWVYADTVSVQNGFFGLYSNSSNRWFFRLNSSNKFQFSSAVSGSTKTNKQTVNTFSANTWYHVAFVQDGTAIKIYVDGSSESLSTLGGTDHTVWLDNLSGIATKANIGAQIGTNYFNGYVHDVRIWDTNLSAAQITSDYNSGCPTTPLATNLAIHYKMGEGSTYSTINDEVGALDGTMTNMESGDITSTTPC